MIASTRIRGLLRSLPVFATLLVLTACGTARAPEVETTRGIMPHRAAFAIQEAETLRAAGKRVWCVPFARNASGVQIRGNAGTWWDQAIGQFPTGKRPVPGAVMAFSSTPSLPMGHVAVVSKVLSDRMILIDHANWERNKVSLGMAVKDVSDANDWSRVRVESQPGTFGSVYLIDGFISPASTI
ncbi:CHAP domain-containing protein [Mesobaculum littorinae]|uniref:CHAP domain-containing protein n=1 Tax=Mesobaculum littorinae TaxID=2486419 RepID=A0A438AHH0_9RHOB|nr:CHAP domain-containing protein [Mesobaculum littorinae]RVV98150.1 CHAP domain-containing protein [Mesobaculum littorinae]